MIPEIVTERLRLRGPRRDDFPPVAAFWASERSVHQGGPRDMVGAWEDFAAGFGLWLIDGLGTWVVEVHATGAFAGIVGISHPAHFPETEVGWTLTAEAEGQGYAQEAARAVVDWVWTNTDLASLVVYIDPANARSIRVAERLGAVRDDAAAVVDPGDVVFRLGRPGVSA